MSSIPPETVEVLEEVVRLTSERRLTWDTVRVPHETGGVYVSLASGELELSQSTSRGLLGDIHSIAVRIRNEDGVQIYSFSVSRSDRLYDALRRTYDLAWKQALGAPDTLAKMREELATR